ncbi:MAG: diaminopimelate epimerase, partial [Sphingomonadales bacterium]|nr:diaminopimelate epimerase [Sphingomonadales bacterium]
MTNGSATGRRVFVKMHGCGNDFAVFDARTDPLRLGPEEARAIADRRTGIGCDQVLTILPSQAADAVMRIQNADGSEVAACGNGARCVASVLALEALTDMVIETGAGLLNARVCGDGRVTVDMGAPRLEWNEIPLARPQDTLKLDLSVGSLSGPAAVSMGNP